MHHLRRILAPQSIAVIGASEQPGKVGTVTLNNVIAGGFTGLVYPVNPHRDRVHGLKAYHSLAELPQTVDLAILCTPAETIPELVRQCGETSVGGLIILSAGFRESGPGGASSEGLVRQEARKFPNMRIIGPNCLGAIVPGSKLNASFAASMPLEGRVAFVSQSGALCTAVLDWAADRALGFSVFISVGNMLDVSFGDLLDYLAQDPQTKSIILYIESIENARAFMSAARACTRTKPIVAYKAGRFAESAHAAASHTGALAGVDSVYEAAFERAGIVRVFEVNDLFDCAELLSRGPRVSGERLAIVTNAGGPGVMACDALLTRKGSLAQLAPATFEQLNRLLPASWSHGNPVDVLGDASPERFADAVRIVSADPGVDVMLAILTPQGMTDPSETARRVVEVQREINIPIIANWMGASTVRAGIRILNDGGIPTANTPNDAVGALLNLVRYRHTLDIAYETPREVPLEFSVDRRELRPRLEKLFSSQREILFEAETKSILAAYGIPVSEPREGHTSEEVAAIASQIGFPVVLKVVSPQVVHKTEVGGVALNLTNEGEVLAAYHTMLASVMEKCPDAEVQAISVQPMVTMPGGMELIIGIKKDPVFGPVIMVGLGGIAAELFQDRALGLPPLNERLAMHMLESLRTWPLIKGYRGRQAIADVDRLIEILLRFSALASDFPEIRELDANPVVVRGREAIVLDARLVVDQAAAGNPEARRYNHLAIAPYPDDLMETAAMSDGTPITLRPIRPEDEPLWRQLLASCSRKSLWERFRFGFKTDTHEAAIRFCFVDYDRELTVAAEANLTGGKRLAGVARLTSDIGQPRAEFAILVGDAWQGKGLGTLLTQYCLKHSDRIGIAEIYATTARDNLRMIRVFQSLGFQVRPSTDSTLMNATRAVD